MTAPLKLQLALKGRFLREYTLCEETVLIGRDPEAHIVLDNDGVSRDQARILRSPEGWTLEDKGSANGTWLNRRRIVNSPLKDRDEITIGKFTLRVCLTAEPAVNELPSVRPRPRSPAEPGGTTVLNRAQVASILALPREEAAARLDAEFPSADTDGRERRPAWRRGFVMAAAFLACVAVGAALAMLWMR